MKEDVVDFWLAVGSAVGIYLVLNAAGCVAMHFIKKAYKGVKS
jgi:hypothetical protein